MILDHLQHPFSTIFHVILIPRLRLKYGHGERCLMCPEKNDECDVSGVFTDAVERYMAEYDQVYSESTVKDRRRELMRLCRIVGDLLEEGRVSTADPGSMTAQDVKEVAVALKASGVAVNTRVHALGRLNLLCKFCGNICVEHAKVRYPALFPSKRETRLGVLSRSDVNRIFSCAEAADGFTELRMHLSVTISLGAGLRPQEVRFVREDDFSEDLSELTVTHPKGADTFGEVRTVPVHPRTSAVAGRYLGLFRSRGMSGYLFQGPHGDPVASNTQRLWRSKVVEETGVDFDHRALRRTWGQGLLDAGLSEEEVSVLLGHASTATTAKYYARTREGTARDLAHKVWGRARGSGETVWNGRR